MNKKIRLGVLFLICVLALSFNVQAATKKKKIKNVSFKITADIEPDSRPGSEKVEVTVSSDNYYYDSYEPIDTEISWTEDSIPKLKLLFIVADDDYTFDIVKESQIKIDGAKYLSGVGVGSQLSVTVELPALKNKIEPLTGLNLNANGLASWNESAGAGSYEVRLTRGTGSVIGGSQIVGSTSIDLLPLMTKAGNYFVKVRPISKGDSNSVGAWETSTTVYITDAKAKEARDKANVKQATGTWVGATPLWSYVLADGTRIKSDWRFVNGEWYYFSSNGYAVSGWTLVNDKWYYFDTNDNHMWKNATTPDGYEVDITGAWIKK